MRFMLLIHTAEDDWTAAERTDCMVKSLGVCADLTARGQFVDSAPLESVRTAATVRVPAGRPVVTDGPFAEVKEQLGGYYVLDVPDRDAALAVALRLPAVHKGTIEIRAMETLDGLPPSRPISAVEGTAGLTPFLLLSYDDEAAWREAGAEALNAAKAEAAGLAREMAAAGTFVSASPLAPAASATCVRVRGGAPVVTDGPYAETREMLGGYYLMLAESRAEALGYAARHPGTRFGAVEVRPVFDLSGLRKSAPVR
jgi:hypothetical protein